jgi:5-methylcytosine-specific restriction endonuclease McrA
MKRTALRRKTPLASGGGLRRTGIVPPRASSLARRGGWKAKRSSPRVDEWPEITAAVYARDGRCLLHGSGVGGGCFGKPLTPHHLRKSGQGGPDSVENVVALCAFHNDWVETAGKVAHLLGLVIRNGETWEDAWRRMRCNRLVSYGPDGAPTPYPDCAPDAA